MLKKGPHLVQPFVRTFSGDYFLTIDFSVPSFTTKG